MLGEFEGTYVSDAEEPAVEMSSNASVKTDEPPASETNFASPTRQGQSNSRASVGGRASANGGGNRRHYRQNYNVGIHFRKTIIPILLVMAIILIALGVFTHMKVKNSTPETIANNPFLEHGGLFAGVSIALGVCLIAGSLFFHYEVKKHHRANGGGKK